MKLKHIELNNMVKQTNPETGFYYLEKDLEALEAYLKFEYNEKYIKFSSQYNRIKKYVDDKFYHKDLLKLFTKEQYEELDKYAKGFNFKFKSYMSAKKFFEDYALKTNDRNNILESYEDKVIVVSAWLSQGNLQKAKEYIEEILCGRYQPATPTFQEAGRYYSGEMVSCFLLEMDDNINSITYNLGTAMQLSKIGGGVAINVSNIRGRGETLRGVEGITAGVMPILKLMEDTFSFANKLDQRNGAGAAYLSIFHWDLIEFLDTKKINADEKNRIQQLSLGLIVYDKFFELAKENKEIALFAPHTIKQAYDLDLAEIDMNTMYDKLIDDDKVKKQFVSARKILLKIAQTQMESGYPYIVYIDEANRQHALKDIGKIKMSNLCTEIFQLQEKSIINNYFEKDEIKRDINCNLGSINIVSVMENKDIEKTVSIAVDALTAVVDLTDIKEAPGIRKANEELRAVGLGTLNLHGFFVKNRIFYESEHAIEFVRVFYSTLNYYSLKRSNEIAKERKSPFKDFDKSEYAKGTYFDKYLDNDYLPTSSKLKEIFEGIKLPSKEDWRNLKQNVIKYGLYHAYRMAIAPNSSTGYIANATPSIMPITSVIETRTYGHSTTYYPMPYLSNENLLLYKSAYNMDQTKILDLVSEIQPHIDQGISTILFVDSDTSTKELAKLYIYGHKKGLKSLYYTRTKNLKVEECELCHA